MTRCEENQIFIDELTKKAELEPSGTHEEMVSFHLGAIAMMLIDISRSLAILADRAEKEG